MSTSSSSSETNNIDALLATELNSLSFQQREKINEEIHGINVDQICHNVKEIEETLELLKDSFRNLQNELNKLQSDSFAYNKCQRLYGNDNHGDGNKKSRKKSYINTDEFRLMFLRCELFDVTKAARRLINFVELMYELYGDVGIQRRIRFDDLSNDFLTLGYSQLLPGRDRAGRRVIVHITPNQTNGYTLESKLRNALYFYMNVADDIETQRKGVVVITWYHKVNMFDDFKTNGTVYSKTNNCFPLRVGALHICISEEIATSTGDDDHSSDSNNSRKSSSHSQSGTSANILKSMFALAIGAKLRTRLRIHTGPSNIFLSLVLFFPFPFF